MKLINCSECQRPTPPYNLVTCGSPEQGYRELCERCFNESMAYRLELYDFESVEFPPIRLLDARGVEHEFHFRSFIFGPGMALDAFELQDDAPGGYEFQVIGDPEGDPFELLARLIAKIRRALARTHIEDTPLGPQVNDGGVVRGTVGCDLELPGRMPTVTIDGREFTWEELGQMVGTYEGSQFRLEFFDRSDEA